MRILTKYREILLRSLILWFALILHSNVNFIFIKVQFALRFCTLMHYVNSKLIQNALIFALTFALCIYSIFDKQKRSFRMHLHLHSHLHSGSTQFLINKNAHLGCTHICTHICTLLSTQFQKNKALTICTLISYLTFPFTYALN